MIHHTLDILSRLLGLKDWDEFLNHIYGSDGSNPILSFHISIDELVTEDLVKVSWKPNRRCTFRYLGESEFMVEKSENSQLKEGDTFRANLFILNEPLYLDNLVQGENPPVTFVVGNRGGLCELEKITK